jgi:hypothetical protein
VTSHAYTTHESGSKICYDSQCNLTTNGLLFCTTLYADRSVWPAWTCSQHPAVSVHGALDGEDVDYSGASGSMVASAGGM